MIKPLICITFTLIINISFAQNSKFALVQKVYDDWLTFSFNRDNQCSHILINDSVDYSLIVYLKEGFLSNNKFIRKELQENNSLKKDSIIFDSSEIRYIINQIEKLNSNRWPENIFPHSKIIHPHQIDSLYNSIQSLPPMEKLCYNVYTFSNPILLRDNKICILYTEERTFSTVEGECWIYIKKHKTWQRFLRIYFRGK